MRLLSLQVWLLDKTLLVATGSRSVILPRATSNAPQAILQAQTLLSAARDRELLPPSLVQV